MTMMQGDDPSAYKLESASLTLDEFLPLPLAIHAAAVEDSSEEDYDDDATTTTQQSRSNRRHKNSRNRANNNGGSQNDGAILLEDSSRVNRSGKIFNKLRKNDVVKVVDTPSGRAGFVYQSASNPVINTKTNNVYSSSSSSGKTSFASANYPPYANRNANDVKLTSADTSGDETGNSKKKILPVLTADGKIALVVRGDPSRSFNENANVSSRYEPIHNLTSIITALNNNNDNNNHNNVNTRQNDSITTKDETNDPLKTLLEQNRKINRLDEFFASVTNKVKKLEEVAEHDLNGSSDVEREDDESGNVESPNFNFDESHSTSTTAPSSTAAVLTGASTDEPNLYEEDASRKNLLQINRPLSEVLGLPKKTYYNHPIESFNTDTTKLPTTRQQQHSQHSHSTEQQIVRRTNNSSSINTPKITTEGSVEEFDHESPEVINIAVIPGFDSEMEKKLFGYDRNNNQNDQTSSASETIQQCGAHSLRIMIVVVCGLLFVAFH